MVKSKKPTIEKPTISKSLPSFNIEINGITHKLSILQDIKWREFKEVMKNLATSGGDFSVIADSLLPKVVVCDTFDFTNSQSVEDLPGLVMAEITGQILDLFPLVEYLDKLKVGAGGNLDRMIKEVL